MSSAHPVVAPEDRTVYPVEERLGEDIVQRWIVELLRPLIARWFAERGEPTFVGADQFVYYRQYDPLRRIAPDVYVMPGVAPDTPAKSWKLWEWQSVPSLAIEVVSQDWEKDYHEAPDKYGELGAQELIVFDPHHEERPERVRFQRFARPGGKWQRVEHTNQERLRSEVLGAWLRSVDTGDQVLLRIATNPAGDELFPTAEEAAEAREKAERRAKERALARVRELEEELKRR
jgi:hypothetical protein